MTKNIFKVDRREGGKDVNKIRMSGGLMGNVFGLGKPSQAIKMGYVDFVKLYREVGDNGLIYLKVSDISEEIPVLVDEVQADPVSAKLVHVAFKQVDLKEKVRAEIPIEVVGEFDVLDAVLVTVKNEVEVEALPTDLPEKFEVDVSSLKAVGDSIMLSSLEYDSSKIELILGEAGLEEPVVLVQEQKEEVEEEVVEETVTEEAGSVTKDGEAIENETQKNGVGDKEKTPPTKKES